MKTICANCGFEDEGTYCSQCGALLRPNQKEGFKTALVGFVRTLLSIFKIGEFFRLIVTSVNPVAEIRKILARKRLSFPHVLLTYFEIIFAMNYLNQKIVIYLGKSIDYPLVARGAILETDLLLTAFTVIINGLWVAIWFLFPKSLFLPQSRMTVISINYLYSIYVVLYMAVGDITKLLIWHIFHSFLWASILGNVIIIAVTVLGLYIYRRVLSLRWKSIIILTISSFLIGFAQGFTLARFRIFYFG